jgi:hypothetical protein
MCLRWLRSRALIAVLLTISIWACDAGTLSNPSTIPDEGGFAVQPSVGSEPKCLPGCTESDPDPSAPGVFLTSAVTGVSCFLGGQNDRDSDGVFDRCESDLAAAFAPELRYYSGDEIGREPHWAARKAGTNHIYLIYLLSYYRDAGNTSFGCSLPFHDTSCGGHNGDSENIQLEVYYNPSSQHWLLHSAAYSAHSSFNTFVRGTAAYPALQYPAKFGAYPRAYVSQGKHANYGSQSSCNGGGTISSDDCRLVNTSARVYAAGIVNIGSRAVHTPSQHCMTSTNPAYQYYGSGRQECYWTNTRFRGWIPTTVGGADSDPYSPILAAAGF